MRTTNGTLARDIKVRSQIRYQKKRQNRLLFNHQMEKHTKQKAMKCSACNPEPLILVLANGEKRRIR